MNGLKNKKATINPKTNDENCFRYALTVALNSQNIPQRKKTVKEYRKLNPLLITIIREKSISHHLQKPGKSLNKTIRQLLLISCLYHTILRKWDLHTNQSITLSVKIK